MRKEFFAWADRSILPCESRFGLPVDEGFVTLVDEVDDFECVVEWDGVAEEEPFFTVVEWGVAVECVDFDVEWLPVECDAPDEWDPLE